MPSMSLRPAHYSHAVGKPRQLAHGMEGDLGVVGASLCRQIAPGARFDQLVAIEGGQVDEGRRPLGCEAIAILPILNE
jgi:hypothetical protein